MRMALLAERISATEAYDFGLVSSVHPADELESAVATVIDTLVSGPAISLRKTKQAINAATLTELESAIGREVDGQAVLLTSRDFREGTGRSRSTAGPPSPTSSVVAIPFWTRAPTQNSLSPAMAGIAGDSGFWKEFLPGAGPTPPVGPPRHHRQMTDEPNYTYRAEWSASHFQYRAICLEFPGLHGIAPTPHEAIEQVQALVAQIVAEYAEADMAPPAVAHRPHLQRPVHRPHLTGAARAADRRSRRAGRVDEPVGRLQIGRAAAPHPRRPVLSRNSLD